MSTVLSKKGQIVLPNAVREQMHLKPGQDFEVVVDDEDTILLSPDSRPPNQGLGDHLLACPSPFDLPARAKDSSAPSPLL
jgi:AbrB family looped-hinge helix DNA binding protein